VKQLYVVTAALLRCQHYIHMPAGEGVKAGAWVWSSVCIPSG
jgi:hypothetical protein